MESSEAKGTQPPSEAKGIQPPPPGYPTDSTPPKKRPCGPRTKKRGEKGFIEGCLAALCCCWLCETCC